MLNATQSTYKLSKNTQKLSNDRFCPQEMNELPLPNPENTFKLANVEKETKY